MSGEIIGRGILTAVVWPTHIGVVGPDGVEPVGDPEYQRGQITWAVVDDVLEGMGLVETPAGEWTHVVYGHHPVQGEICNVQKFAHPFVFHEPGIITLAKITEHDIRPLDPDPVIRD